MFEAPWLFLGGSPCECLLTWRLSGWSGSGYLCLTVNLLSQLDGCRGLQPAWIQLVPETFHRFDIWEHFHVCLITLKLHELIVKKEKCCTSSSAWWTTLHILFSTDRYRRRFLPTAATFITLSFILQQWYIFSFRHSPDIHPSIFYSTCFILIRLESMAGVFFQSLEINKALFDLIQCQTQW